LAVLGAKAALLAGVPVQREGGGTLEQGRSQASALREEFAEVKHGETRRKKRH
jgi:hypothetical protein